jgi:hypothetical protein
MKAVTINGSARKRRLNGNPLDVSKMQCSLVNERQRNKARILSWELAGKKYSD